MRFELNQEIEIHGKIYDVSAKSLDFSSEDILDEWLEVVSKYISSSPRTQELNLSNNRLTNAHINEFFQWCMLADSLITIDLSYNFITLEDSQMLVNYLQTTQRLQTLNLSYNDISDEGLKILSSWLKNNTTIKYLSLLQNKSISIDGITYLKEALLVNKSITELEISLYTIWIQWAREMMEVQKYNNRLTLIYN